MECRSLVEAVTAYIEGNLSAEDRARFEEHVARCDGCANYLAQIRETIRLTGTLDLETIPTELRTALQEVFRAWSLDR